MNFIMRMILKKKWNKFRVEHPTGAKMIIYIITRIFWLASFLLKNFSLFLGVVEQILKILAGIVSFTPTRKDDLLVQEIENLFDTWQKNIYIACEKITYFYNNIWKKIT